MEQFGEELAEARAALTSADMAESPALRFVTAQLAAVRAASGVLAVRGRRQPSGRPRNLWLLLGELAPELREWAGLFAITQAKRDALSAGAPAWTVSEREADDLLRDAAAFIDEMARWQARHRDEGAAARAG